jgi:hypothetical protein
MVYTALLSGAIGSLIAGACDDQGNKICSDAANARDCEAIVLSSEGHRCGWVTVRSLADDGTCALEEEHEECVEFAGTQAGCLDCGTTGYVIFGREDPEVPELLLTTLCGPSPIGWHSCGEPPANPFCDCQEC